MGFDNKNSYWIDTFIKKYEESFKSIYLIGKVNIGGLLLLRFGMTITIKMSYLLKNKLKIIF